MNQKRQEIPYAKEILITAGSLLITGVASLLFLKDTVSLLLEDAKLGATGSMTESLLFIFIMLFLLYGNVIYQAMRIAHMKRLRRHQPEAPRELSRFLAKKYIPTVAILIPSYKEEVNTIKMTVLSAAAQIYPNKQVILLVDDPPFSQSPRDLRLLEEVKTFIEQLNYQFQKEARYFQGERSRFKAQHKRGFTAERECKRVSKMTKRATAVLFAIQEEFSRDSHIETFFCKKILQDLVKRCHDQVRYARELTTHASRETQWKGMMEIYSFYAQLFQGTITTFKRKQYENLSHEPNKAMNLNSYIGLMGKRLVTVQEKEKKFLKETKEKTGSFVIPDAEYIITLDADSIIVPDYALRLVWNMERPENRNVAVLQSPYNAFPNAPSPLERLAGATTDIQYLIHQGFTYFNATFWVGANALLRKTALEDIAEHTTERTYSIVRYVQDRTAIEDTESSIDLIRRGWRLLNYPERLAYSATPSDFGALLIQRRRWANGGLLIFPKLVRYMLQRGPARTQRLVEGIVRAHYLTSIAGVNVGILLVILYPFEEEMRVFWVVVASAPYFFLYGRDLAQIGYRISDLPKIYALNLMLILINLGGVIKSIQQMITKKRIPFGRTPKIQGRTAAPASYVLGELFLLCYTGFAVVVDLWYGNWVHAAFSLFNMVMFLYVFFVLMQFRQSFEDIRIEVGGLWKKTKVRLLP